MNTSFIVFNIIGLIIIVIAAIRIGVKISKATKLEAPEAQNKKSYEDALANVGRTYNSPTSRVRGTSGEGGE